MNRAAWIAAIPATTPPKIAAASLRHAGYSYRDIAKELRIPLVTAWRWANAERRA